MLADAKRPVVLVGNSVLQDQDGVVLYALVSEIAEKLKSSKTVDPEWRVLNVMQRVRYSFLRYCFLCS